MPALAFAQSFFNQEPIISTGVSLVVLRTPVQSLHIVGVQAMSTVLRSLRITIGILKRQWSVFMALTGSISHIQLR